eukprot:CAMPEP_0198225566 /NCGR_PEP_ID=MMETSP1445-20131203/101627_1 /TAXON_ID=36898 /ORGANISM="Pyramimonas sp., Strain CCMP2087" /LENGTH=57 /DNA_ID=CAMNT_0043905131 /DNA_START=36 /DNA_END=206 /DNA_ORIENTATION=-
MQLRKVCNHPFLLEAAETELEAAEAIKAGTDRASTRQQLLADTCGKLQVTQRLLTQL